MMEADYTEDTDHIEVLGFVGDSDCSVSDADSEADDAKLDMEREGHEVNRESVLVADQVFDAPDKKDSLQDDQLFQNTSRRDQVVSVKLVNNVLALDGGNGVAANVCDNDDSAISKTMQKDSTCDPTSRDEQIGSPNDTVCILSTPQNFNEEQNNVSKIDNKVDAGNNDNGAVEMFQSNILESHYQLQNSNQTDSFKISLEPVGGSHNYRESQSTSSNESKACLSESKPDMKMNPVVQNIEDSTKNDSQRLLLAKERRVQIDSKGRKDTVGGFQRPVITENNTRSVNFDSNILLTDKQDTCENIAHASSEDMPLSSLRKKKDNANENSRAKALPTTKDNDRIQSSDVSVKTSNKSVVSNRKRSRENSLPSFPSAAAIRKHIFEVEIVPKLQHCGWKIFRKFHFDTDVIDWIIYPPVSGHYENDAEYFTSHKLLLNHLCSDKYKNDGVVKWVIDFLNLCDDIIRNDGKSKHNNHCYNEDLDFTSHLVIERAKEILSTPIFGVTSETKDKGNIKGNHFVIEVDLRDALPTESFLREKEEKLRTPKSPNHNIEPKPKQFRGRHKSQPKIKEDARDCNFPNAEVKQKSNHQSVSVTTSKKIPRCIISAASLSTKDVTSLKGIIGGGKDEVQFDIALTTDPSDTSGSILQYTGPRHILSKVESSIEKFLNCRIEQAYLDKVVDSSSTFMVYAKVTVAHDLDFEVGEGDNKKDGLFLYNTGRSIKEIIGEKAATSGACLFALNSVRLRSVSELKQVWKDAVSFGGEVSILFYLIGNVDWSKCNFDKISKVVYCDGSVPKAIEGQRKKKSLKALVTDTSTKVSSQKADKDNCVHSSNNALFCEKIQPVYEIEFSNINKHTVMKSMWDLHKRHFGENCTPECKCVLNLKVLTRSVLDNALSKLKAKGESEKKLNWESCGFINHFSSHYTQILLKRYPNVNPKVILEKMLKLWNKHKSQIGLICSPSCRCHSEVNGSSTFPMESNKKNELESKRKIDRGLGILKRTTADSISNLIGKKPRFLADDTSTIELRRSTWGREDHSNTGNMPINALGQLKRNADSIHGGMHPMSFQISKKEKISHQMNTFIINDDENDDTLSSVSKPSHPSSDLTGFSKILSENKKSSMSSTKTKVLNPMAIQIGKKEKRASTAEKIVKAQATTKYDEIKDSTISYRNAKQKVNEFRSKINSMALQKRSSLSLKTNIPFETTAVTRISAKKSTSKQQEGENEFVITFEPYNNVMGIYCYSSFDGKCLVYSISPFFYEQFSGYPLKSGAEILKVAEYCNFMTMSPKDVSSHHDIKSFYDQARISRKKIKVWFKLKDHGKKEDFSNDWTETGAWKGASLVNGWAGGAAETSTQCSIEKTPKTGLHISEDSQSCFAKRVQKGTRVTFANNICKEKFYNPTSPVIEYETPPIQSVPTEIGDPICTGTNMETNEARFFRVIKHGSFTDLVKCFDEGATTRCTDDTNRSPFVVINDLIIQIRNHLNLSNASPLPTMTVDERARLNQFLRSLEQKKVILKIYHMAEKVVGASQAIEDLRSIDVLKLRVPFVSDLMLSKKAKTHPSASELFLTMSLDKGKMENATPPVALNKNSSWHQNNLKEYSFQLRHGHNRDKSVTVHLLKGSMTDNIKLGICNKNCGDLLSSSTQTWTREDATLESVASNIEFGKIVIEKRSILRVFEIRESLRNLMTWIKNFNKTDDGRLSLNLCLVSQGGISLLNAAVYIEDTSVAKTIVDDLDPNLVTCKRELESSLELAESLDKIYKSGRRKKILAMIRNVLGISTPTTTVMNASLPRSRLFDHLSKYTTASFGNSTQQECKNFMTDEGCRFGSRCHFLHIPRLMNAKFPRLKQGEVSNPVAALTALYKSIHNINIDSTHFLIRNENALHDSGIKSYTIYSVSFTCPVNNFLILAASHDALYNVNGVFWFKNLQEAMSAVSRTAIRIIFYEHKCFQKALVQLKSSKNINNMYQHYFPKYHLKKSCWSTSLLANGCWSASFVSPGQGDKQFASPKDEEYRSEMSAKLAAFEVFIRVLHRQGALLSKYYTPISTASPNSSNAPSDQWSSGNNIHQPPVKYSSASQHSNTNSTISQSKQKHPIQPISVTRYEPQRNNLVRPSIRRHRDGEPSTSNLASIKEQSSLFQEARTMVEKENNLQALYTMFFPSHSLKKTSWKVLKKTFKTTMKYKAILVSPAENDIEYESNKTNPGEWFFSERDAKKATFSSFLVTALQNRRRL